MYNTTGNLYYNESMQCAALHSASRLAILYSRELSTVTVYKCMIPKLCGYL